MKRHCIKFWILLTLFVLQTQLFALDKWGYLQVYFPFPQTQQEISSISHNFAWTLENYRSDGQGIYEDAVILTMPPSLNSQFRAEDYKLIAKTFTESASRAQYIVFDITNLNETQIKAQKQIMYDLENYFSNQKQELKFGFVFNYGVNASTNKEILNLFIQHQKKISYLNINGDWISFTNNISHEAKNKELNTSIDFLDLSGIEVIDPNANQLVNYLTAFTNLHGINLSSVFFKDSENTSVAGTQGQILAKITGVLKKYENLSYLNLSSNGFTSVSTILISDIISKVKNLVYINLSKNNFIGDEINRVFEKLAEKTQLTYLNVSSSTLGERNAKSFAKIIQNNKNLDFIDISFNYFSTDGYRTIDVAQQVSHNLQVHKVRGNHILYKQYPKNEELHHEYPKLFYFDFGDNNFYFSHSEPIPASVGFPKTLRYLYMDADGLNTAKLPQLINAIIRAKELRSLNLSNNNIDGNAGIQSIVKLLDVSKNLIRIDLHGNNFTQFEMSQIAQSLSGLPDIKYLDLGNNVIGSDSISTLAKYFSKTSELGQLHMENSHLSNKSALILASGLKSQDHLSVLNLSFNDIEKSGLKALLKVLETKTKFTTLIIHGNRVDCRDVYDIIESPKFQCQ